MIRDAVECVLPRSKVAYALPVVNFGLPIQFRRSPGLIYGMMIFVEEWAELIRDAVECVLTATGRSVRVRCRTLA